MTQESINQITSQDLGKINEYLDQMEEDLKNHYTEKEIIEIVQMTREQLFQQIEYQVALDNSFDIDAIIVQNRKNNDALLQGNDRNQIVLTIPNPFSTSSYMSKPSITQQQSPIEKDTSEPVSDSVASKTMETTPPQPQSPPYTSQYTPILVNEIDEAYILMVLAFIMLIVSFIPTIPTLIISMIILPLFLMTSAFVVKNRKKLWLKSNLLVILSFFFYADSVYYAYRANYPYVENFQFLALLMIPVFSIVFVYQILKQDILLDFTDSSDFVQFVSYFIVLSLFYAFVGGISTGIFLLQDNLEFPIVTSIVVAILAFIVYRFLISPRLMIWDQLVERSQQLQQKHQSVSEQSTGDRPENEIEIPQSDKHEKQKRDHREPVKIDRDYYQQSSLFNADGNERVYVEVDRNAVNNYLGFKWITPFRIPVLLAVIGIFAFAFYFSRITNQYEVIYYQKLLGYDYPNYSYLQFQADFTDVILEMGLMILGLFGVLLVVEFIRWISRQSKKKVISHLVLRQGSTTVSMLNQLPPDMNTKSYYNALGELIFEDLIVIRHQEAS